LPFLENNNEYWGRPADSQQAITEIERMRKSGCTHIIRLARQAYDVSPHGSGST
jgi:hypothetical protein